MLAPGGYLKRRSDLLRGLLHLDCALICSHFLYPVTSSVENADLFALPDHFATDFPGYPRTTRCNYESHFKAVIGDQPPVMVSLPSGTPELTYQ